MYRPSTMDWYNQNPSAFQPQQEENGYDDGENVHEGESVRCDLETPSLTDLLDQNPYYGSSPAEMQPYIDQGPGGEHPTTNNHTGQAGSTGIGVRPEARWNGDDHSPGLMAGESGPPSFSYGSNAHNWIDRAPSDAQLPSGVQQQVTDSGHTGFVEDHPDGEPCLYGQANAGALDDPDTEAAPHEMIGIILSNGAPRADKYQCHFEKCGGQTFSRLADLKRHFSGRHLIPRPEFWCLVPDCDRSQDNGNYPFPRKDKMKDHVLKMHGLGL
jgi:hypothetical protein